MNCGFRIKGVGIARTALLAMLVISSPSRVANAQQQRDPKVQAILDQCITATRALNSIHLRVSVKVTNPDVFLEPPPESVDLRFQRPNKFRAEILEIKSGKPFKKVIVSDGASLWRWQTGAKTEKAAAPKSLAEVQDVPPVSPALAILMNPAFDFKDWPAANVNLRLANPEKLGTEEVDVVEGGMGESGVSGGANLRLYIGKKDHLVRQMVVQVNGKVPVTNQELSGKYEAINDVVETSPVFAPSTFMVGPAIPNPQLLKPNNRANRNSRR